MDTVVKQNYTNALEIQQREVRQLVSEGFKVYPMSRTFG